MLAEGNNSSSSGVREAAVRNPITPNEETLTTISKFQMVIRLLHLPRQVKEDKAFFTGQGKGEIAEK